MKHSDLGNRQFHNGVCTNLYFFNKLAVKIVNFTFQYLIGGIFKHQSVKISVQMYIGLFSRIGIGSIRVERGNNLVLSLRTDVRIVILGILRTESAVEEDTSPIVEKGTLYLRLPNEQEPLFGKIKAILNMFPGDNSVVLYFADTGIRRGSKCALYKTMLTELRSVLGHENVVIK